MPSRGSPSARPRASSAEPAAKARPSQSYEERRWQEARCLLDPSAERDARREEIDRSRAERWATRQRPRSAVAHGARSRAQRPISAPSSIVAQVSAVRPGTYTLLRDVVPQLHAALNSRPKGDGKTIHTGAPFFVVRTAVVHDQRGGRILRVKDASRGWISTVDHTGRNIHSHTGRHEDHEELCEAQRELDEEQDQRHENAAKGAALDVEGSSPWISSAGGWWASKDRRVLDERLAAATTAERQRAQPAENAELSQNPCTSDCGVSLRDELDDCFGCGNLVRVDAALARAQACHEEVEHKGMGMVVRMLATYADALRKESGSNANVMCSDHPASRVGSTDMHAQLQGDISKTTLNAAAQQLVDRSLEKHRLSLNPFAVARAVGEMPEVTGPAVFCATDGKEVIGVPYHVDRRRDLSDAKRIVSSDLHENRFKVKAKGKGKGKEKGKNEDKVTTGRTQLKHCQSVTWDEDTQTYKWSNADLGPTEAPPQRICEPTSEEDVSMHYQTGHGEIQSGQSNGKQAQTTHRLTDGVGSVLNINKRAWADLKVKITNGGAGHTVTEDTTTTTTTMATTASAKVSQVRQEQLTRQRQRLEKLRAAARAAQAEAEVTARVQTMMAAVSSGSVQRLHRLGLGRGRLHITRAQQALKTGRQLSSSTAAHCGDGSESKAEAETETEENKSMLQHSVLPVEAPAELSKRDQARWNNNGLPALSTDEIEALLTAKNCAGQTALSLARQRNQQVVYDHLKEILCEHLATVIPAAFGAAGGGLQRIEQVNSIVKILPASTVRRSEFYDDWMALEEYYKLLLRAEAEARVKEAKQRALAKRRAAEVSAAKRRQRREEAMLRRTEAEQAKEAAAVKAEADRRLEAKVQAALAEADQAAKAAEADADTAAWAAKRLKRRVRKRAHKGGWKLNKSSSGFKQLSVEAAELIDKGDDVSSDLMFFDSVAAQVL